MPEQMVVVPEIAAGCAGVLLMVTANVCAVLLPQALSAVTVMLPPVDPTVVVIELVDDVPVHPPGNVHV